MAETLFIRLGSNKQEPIHWLIFADNQEGIIASGELSSADELTQLSEKAQHREVVAFIPACDVAFKSLKVPSKSVRAMRQAVPYMLEDELAQDVEQLFFAYQDLKTDKDDNNCFVAAVQHKQMEHWQSWLSTANIPCKTMIPDALVLPYDGNNPSAILLGQQVLLRTSHWLAMAIDNDVWPVVTKELVKENDITINTYSTLVGVNSSLENAVTDINNTTVEETTDESHQVFINALPEELPLALLAANVNKQSFNLLQNEYQIKTQHSPTIKNWLWAASIAICALLLNVALKGTQLIQLNSQQAQVEQQIISSYKKAFPQTKRVRVATIRSQLNQKLSGLAGGNQSGFLTMLSQVQPALALVPELKPETLKYDGKRNEIRMQAVANDYQYFDKLKNALEEHGLTVTLGAQSNQGAQISGSFSISAKRNTTASLRSPLSKNRENS
jgi:general secretion pathway protein L